MQDAGYTVDGHHFLAADVDAMAASMVNVWTPLVHVGRKEGCMQVSRGSYVMVQIARSSFHTLFARD